MAKTKQLQIRPYARLLTMLGDQLIKNERIALIELIKNSYDADAKWVKITFKNFGAGYKITPESKIIITDDGHGMSSEIIEKHWLNPATPEKKRRKATKDTTPGGRVIQGEKGIGRFSILKLGKVINIITRAKSENEEHKIVYDFANYDDEFLTEDGKEKNLFLEDLKVSLTTREPKIFIKKKRKLGARIVVAPPFGTRIVISNLKGSWTPKKVEAVANDIVKLESIFSNRTKKGFQVFIYADDEQQLYQKNYLEKLTFLLNERSVFKIEGGFFDSKKSMYTFKLNGQPQVLDLKDPTVTGIKIFKDRYGNAGSVLENRKLECGSFNFGFYIFDFSANAPVKFQLDKDDKKRIKSHRIYLYRDGVRVYPYGEPDDDWLRIDAYRGTIGAGHFLSNDQVVGYVNITQKHNPNLMDKTNREGLIDHGDATEDFITLLQVFLRYMRQKPYARYREDIQGKKAQDIFKTGQVLKEFDKIKEAVGENRSAQKVLQKAEQAYKTERRYLTHRAETTEELAGVGLSVETASHDIMAIMGRVLVNLDNLLSDLTIPDEMDKEEIIKELQAIRGGLGFVEAQLKDIQLLFTSSKQRRKNIRIKAVIEKVHRLYKGLLEKEHIEFLIDTQGSPLVAKTTDAVLLQVLLNLFDNAVYWLQQASNKNKQIHIVLDGHDGQMIFSDNGPGIEKEDAPYIFEPFYSGKGDEGRGLGLYIARQLLERSDFTINLAEIKSEKILPGANFVVNFVAEE